MNDFILAAQSVYEQEQQTLESSLFWITVIVLGLINGLIVFALFISRIARHWTHPCYWCMEFIPKKEKICPRCGKEVLVRSMAEAKLEIDATNEAETAEKIHALNLFPTKATSKGGSTKGDGETRA